MVKFTECLNDTWDFFFLGDPSNISKFKLEQNLSDDLISEFTTNSSGELVVEKGVLIPLSGVLNFPYYIYFQMDFDNSIFEDRDNDLQFKKSGYLLEVISQEIYLMTVPYLKNWTEKEGINALRSNGIRPKIKLENGIYNVEICGGETKQESGWEPTLEFVLKKVEVKATFAVEDVGFKFEIRSKEY